MRKYDHLGDMIIELADAVKPPERMTVSSAAEKYRVLNNPGSYVGPWKNETTPYLVKPMDTMTSRQYNGCVFVGPAQCGKCLDVDTPIPTPDGFRRMGDMREGDEVFSLDGSVTRVLAVSPVYVGRDCFRLTFDDGSSLVADAAHKWVLYRPDSDVLDVFTTQDILDTYRTSTSVFFVPSTEPFKMHDSVEFGPFPSRAITSIEQVESVPVRCIAVDHPSHLFLAGEGMVPTHNTDMFLNFVTYSVVCDPMDMILYQTSNVMARDFSRRRIDRLHRHSPEVGQRLLPASDSDNVFDKHYRSGMILTLSWPSIAELSGRPVGRVYLTDYDRMPMNVDGEGSPFDLGRKRTTTFGSSAMTVAESSPGFAVKDPRWLRRSPHEAPPTEGILALYNRGTREQWHWLCIHCDTAFEPSFDLLKWPDSEDMLEAAEQAQMMCPHCNALISPDYKYEINATRAMWVPENCVLEKGMQLRGNPVRSDMASFWLKGPAATFASWKDLVSRYLLAEQEWHRTGSQEALKSTVNTDQGEPYYLRGMEVERVPDELKERATSHDKHVVPHGSRFLVASADVQKNQWVVQVFAVAPHETQPYRLHVIDRFEIRKSNRRDDDGDVMWVKPGAFVEDWTLLEEQVLARRYPKADGSGELGVAFFGCDSGGKEGVTSNAYEWFRRLRKYGDGAHLRVMLIKGEGRPDAPRTRISYPDSSSYSARKNIASGDVPVLILNSNVLKDELNSMLDRNAEAGATVTWPSWLPDEFFAEMCSEIRSPKGWENPRKARNEAWDLSYYAVGICRHKRVDRINWDNPPSWAAEGTDNPHFYPTPKPGAEPVAKTAKAHYNSLAELGQKLA